MKNDTLLLSKSKKILLIIVITLILISQPLLSTCIAVGNNNIIVGTFRYKPSSGDKDKESIYYYSDSYFDEAGTVLNSHLRTMSINLALATFQSYNINGDYTKASQNAKNLLEEIGFEDIETNEDFNIKSTEDTVGIIIGRKKINNKDIIVVSVRGAGYEAEWANNFAIGNSEYPSGFEKASKKVTTFIKSYEANHNITNTKIWMTGYSRAAAIINIAGKKINEDLSAYHTTTNDLYIYAFEAPNSVPATSTKYENIHNTINVDDLITYIPPASWGFGRAGVDDTIIHTKGSNEYNELINEFKKQYGKLGVENEYIDDDFVEKYINLDLSSSAEKPIQVLDETEPRTQGQFVQELVSLINDESKFTNTKFTKEGYSEEIEPYIKDLVVTIFNKTSEEKREISLWFSELQENIMTKLTNEVAQGDYMNAFALFMYLSTEELSPAMYSYISSLVITTIDSNDKPECLSDEELETIKNAIAPFLEFVHPIMYHDFMDSQHSDGDSNSIHHLRYITTFVENSSLIIQPHLPEVTLAWMRAMDTYYTTDEVQEGEVSLIETEGTNFCEAKLENIESEDLMNLLTNEEKELLEEGINIKVYLLVNQLEEDEVSNVDKQLIKDSLSNNMKVGCYLDINLLKQIGNGKGASITETDNKVKISIKLPDYLLGKENYQIIRIHDNTTTVIDAVLEDDILTFETDKFSTYALTYAKGAEEDDDETPNNNNDNNNDNNIEESNEENKTSKNINTGDNILLYITVFIISTMGIIILKKRSN